MTFCIGTGKTFIGAQIAYWFTEQNRRNSPENVSSVRRQVLFCGPSNCSVNVVASKSSTLCYYTVLTKAIAFKLQRLKHIWYFHGLVSLHDEINLPSNVTTLKNEDTKRVIA